MNDKIKIGTGSLLIFTLTWYIGTILTAGIWVPSGLFVPGMIIGSGIGLLINNLEKDWFTDLNPTIG